MIKSLAKFVIRIYDFKIFLAVTGLWLLLLLLPNGYIADGLNLTNTIESGAFTRILLSFISVFGFLLSIIILGYGFLREKFRRLALKEFLENRFIIILATSFIAILLINIFTSLYLNGHEITHTSLNLAYYSLFLSTAYFALFLPLALFALSYTDSQALIGKYLEALSSKDFPRAPYYELKITPDERNPLIVLINLLRVYADKDDFHSVEAVIYSAQQKIEFLIGTSHDRELIDSYLKGQTMLWESIIHKSIQKKEYNSLRSILFCIRFYHHHFSKNEIPLLYLQELTRFSNEFAKNIVKNDIPEVVQQTTLTFEQILEDHYDHSAPSEKLIKSLDRFYNKKSDKKNSGYKMPSHYDSVYVNLQWQAISHGIPCVFSTIMTSSIETQNTSQLREALMSLQHLIHTTWTSNLGDYQKAWIMRTIIGDLHFYQIEGLKKGVLEDAVYLFMPDSETVNQMIEKDAPCKKQVLESCTEFILELKSQYKLTNEAINFLGTIGRHCANRYNDSDSYKDTLNYILKVIKYLKKEFEVDLEQNSKNYIALREAVDSFKRFHKMSGNLSTRKKNQDIDRGLLKALDRVLGKFKKVKAPQPTIKIGWDK